MTEEESERMGEEIHKHKELYVPRTPLKFDLNCKSTSLLIRRIVQEPTYFQTSHGFAVSRLVLRNEGNNEAELVAYIALECTKFLRLSHPFQWFKHDGRLLHEDGTEGRRGNNCPRDYALGGSQKKGRG